MTLGIDQRKKSAFRVSPKSNIVRCDDGCYRSRLYRLHHRSGNNPRWYSGFRCRLVRLQKAPRGYVNSGVWAIAGRLLRKRLVSALPFISSCSFADYDPQTNADALSMSLSDYEYLMGASGVLIAAFMILGFIRALK